MRPCTICRELTGAEDSQFARVMGGRLVRAVFSRTADFQIIPSLGPLVVGHSLLVTNAHHTSVWSCMTNTDLYEQVKTLIRQFSEVAVLDDHDELFCFEHGSGDETTEPLCSTTHAHLHLIPLPRDIVRELLAEHFERNALVFDSSRPCAGQGNRPYVLACSTERGGEISNFYVRDATGLESQFMRRAIAKALNLGFWDWKSNLNTSVVGRTIEMGFREVVTVD